MDSERIFMMEAYKKKLTLRVVILILVMLIFLAILLYNQFGASEELKESLGFSFQCGFSAAGLLVLIFWFVKYRSALKDETKLRVLFNQENDERMKAIRAKAGVPMVLILSILLVLAGMIIGFWNETVFVVLIGVALFQLFTSAAVKSYYMRRM